MFNNDKLYDNIIDIVLSSIEFQFENEGEPRWVPSQRVMLKGGQTLTDTGKLRKSFYGQTLSKNIIEVKTDVEYGKYLHYGTISMVSRPIINLTQQDINKINELLIKEIKQWTMKI